MFDGVPEQFHQFIASRASLPIPLSFPLHGPSPSFPTFDLYPSPPQTLLLHHQSPKEKEDINTTLLSTDEGERSIPPPIDPWSNEEVLTLLRVRSSMENWFPDFTWEHVSRKLGEIGYKRSAEKCKEKFEEQSRNFNRISYIKNNNHRMFSELEELYHLKNQNTENPCEEQANIGLILEETSRNETLVVMENPSHQEEDEKALGKSKEIKKWKRKHKFDEMFKSFCENIVNKMMVQQEELHNKILEDMVRRDEEKISREEAWMKQQMDRIHMETERRAHERAVAKDREATIMEFLKKFNSTSTQINQNPNHGTQNKLETPTSSRDTRKNPEIPISRNETLPSQNPKSNQSDDISLMETSSSSLPTSQNSQSTNTTKNNRLASTNRALERTKNSAPNEMDEIGKRWPRDEVLALINLRCSLNGNNEENKEGSKAPLWERMSQGMLELGYNRSSKRCKEKWENINKYFRKTKDVNKKRSLDSRTCPYFNQLSNLYSQGILVEPSVAPENRPTSTKSHPGLPETALISSPGGSDMHNGDEGGKKNVTQVLPADYNFEH